MPTIKPPNQYQLLRNRCLAESTIEFSARGKSVVRCEQCQLATYACICDWCPTLDIECEFVLLMHRNELFKPTNTGRLLADVFPSKIHAFCWSRTEPSAALLALLCDENRQCFIVYPVDTLEAKAKPREVFSSIPASKKITTFILLDGTWKQSSRMFHLSRWLENVPCVLLPEGALRGYAVRKSHQKDYLSTAEAAALCMQMANESLQSRIFLQYFQLFNEHYLATRGCYPPVIGALHEQLAHIVV